tara:strand:- start:141 stop:818 length:678 start_codon:yes stop_codon:yes gene_type:complete
MGNIPFFDILILAMIAVFILNRLRNVLGKKTGNEEDIAQNLNVKTNLKETKPDRELNLKMNKDSNKSFYNLHEDRDINKALNAIKKIETSFELENFVVKAKKAFEYILNAYSENNLKNLKILLDQKIYHSYQKDIEKRIKKNEKFEITIINIKEPIVKYAKVVDKNAQITLEYESEQIHLLKNSKGDIIEGDSNQILNISEQWTFSRELKLRNPNWKLLSISEVN